MNEKLLDSIAKTLGINMTKISTNGKGFSKDCDIPLKYKPKDNEESFELFAILNESDGCSILVVKISYMDKDFDKNINKILDNDKALSEKIFRWHVGECYNSDKEISNTSVHFDKRYNDINNKLKDISEDICVILKKLGIKKMLPPPNKGIKSKSDINKLNNTYYIYTKDPYSF